MQPPHLLSTIRICFELILAWLLWQQLLAWEQGDGSTLFKVQRPQKRQRHPHSPRECPACQEAHGQGAIAEPRPVEPWSKRKSQRGRPKTVETDGYGCPNEDCPYYNITDGQVHALVGYGKHYGADTIQYLKCQACQTKVTTRWNTPMYDLKTPARRVAEVMTASSEGVDVAAASRIFDHDERTIQRWLGRTAEHSQRLHHHFFRDLVCQHLQLDELVTRLRGVKERVFVWVALDAPTKIMPVIHIGTRKREDAQRFVHELWQRLAPGAPPVFTTDGLWLYYYALTAHFGQWVPRTCSADHSWNVRTWTCSTPSDGRTWLT